ncbi:MAG TPA: hypothetical protein VNE39_22690 [Planctomycetota bacterium]|nr:hypothetical protein [Planctomycetota bacterium]
MSVDWCKANYEKSITSRAWGATPYDAGWDGSRRHGEDLPASAELRAIFDEEMALGTVPPWAEEIIRRMIGPLPMCGHYAFPLPLVEICEAIGRGQAPATVHGCYTADAARKTRMAFTVFCLDAWLQGAPLDAAQAELALRDDQGKDWPRIAAAVYQALGAPTPPKRLAVRRLVHRLRWWIKTLVWDDDRRNRFQLDAYLGDARGDEAHFSAYGNSPFGDPYFEERKPPEVKQLDADLCRAVPHGNALLDRIESTWLCAPKAFRYVERIIIEIGALGTGRPPKTNVSLLDCEDTYPDAASHKAWYDSFTASLTAWLDGDGAARPELGEPTPVTHWLVRLLRHKLRLFETHDPFGNLVGAKSSGKRGTRTI